MNFQFDVVVVGAGPSGLAFACTVADGGADVCVVERQLVGGHLNKLSAVDGVPGIDTGYQLSLKLQASATDTGVTLLEDEAVRLKERTLETRSGVELDSANVVIATGRGPGLISTDVFSAWEGRGVTQCVDCDAALARQGPILAQARGPVGVSEALSARHFTDRLTVVIEEHCDSFVLEDIRTVADQVVVNEEIVDIEGLSTVECGILSNGQRVPAAMIVAKDEGDPSLNQDLLTVSSTVIGHAAGWTDGVANLIARAEESGRQLIA